MYTKYDMAQILARVHRPALKVGENLVRVDEGPKPGETVRPRDCHLSNVRTQASAYQYAADVSWTEQFFPSLQRAIEALGIDTTTVDFETWWRAYISRAQ